MSSDKETSSIGLIGRFLLITLFVFFVYLLIIIPILFLFIYFLKFFDFSSFIDVILFCFFFALVSMFFIAIQTLIPAVFLKILKLRIKEGEYDVIKKDKELLKTILLPYLYNVPLFLLTVFKLLPFRMFLHRCAGAKIGKNSFITDTIILYEPYLIEIGENTIIGAGCKICGHIIENNKMIFKKVKIGKNCMVGGEVMIMPGSVIEDNVVVGAKSLVLKDQVLKKGKTYVGIPAKEFIK